MISACWTIPACMNPWATTPPWPRSCWSSSAPNRSPPPSCACGAKAALPPRNCPRRMRPRRWPPCAARVRPVGLVHAVGRSFRSGRGALAAAQGLRCGRDHPRQHRRDPRQAGPVLYPDRVGSRRQVRRFHRDHPGESPCAAWTAPPTWDAPIERAPRAPRTDNRSEGRKPAPRSKHAASDEGHHARVKSARGGWLPDDAPAEPRETGPHAAVKSWKKKSSADAGRSPKAGQAKSGPPATRRAPPRRIARDPSGPPDRQLPAGPSNCLTNRQWALHALQSTWPSRPKLPCGVSGATRSGHGMSQLILPVGQGDA